MSLLRSNQIVGLAEIAGHVYPGGFAFRTSRPMSEHAFVGVLDTGKDKGAGEFIVRNENRVADVHLAKRDVHGVVFARLAWRDRGVFFNCEHRAFPLGCVSKQIVNGEIAVCKEDKHTGKTPPPRPHLVPTYCTRWGRAGSLTRRGFAGGAPTAPTYFLMGMVNRGSTGRIYRKWGSGGLYMARGGGRWGHPSGLGLQPAPLLGLTRPHLWWGHPQLIPTPNAHEMRTRTEQRIGSNAQDLRITANKAEVRG
jgi:hypothetical protein